MSLTLIQALQAHKSLRQCIVPVGGADNQEQPEKVPSEEEDADADPTHLVPQGHGHFALCWSRLATAADNFAKCNAQTESTIIASWLTQRLP